MSAAGRFAVAEHAPQRGGRELLKLRDGSAELVIDANRVVDIAYEDRGVLGLTVVVSGRAARSCSRRSTATTTARGADLFSGGWALSRE